MSTAKQLIPTYVDAQPLYWGRTYVQNMREIRGYPNWWRIQDDKAYIDGPPNEGEQYTKEFFPWSVEILRDEVTDELTDTFELYDLADSLEKSESVVNGDTVYRYKYVGKNPLLSYQHTAPIDSVSLEFDQLGRRMIAFESMGDVFLIWYDTQAADTVTTNFGAGYTPQVVTDTYRRTGGSADSTRILFYVDNTTKQIVYRLQDDRFGVVYTLPNASSDVVEILKVSKNIYGGITVLYVYEESPGNLTTGSFTARPFASGVHVGTDARLLSESKPSAPVQSSVTQFRLGQGAVRVDVENATFASPSASQIITFGIRPAQVSMEDLGAVSPVSIRGKQAGATYGSITDFDIKSSVIYLEDVAKAPIEANSSIPVPTSSSILQFNLRLDAVIKLSNAPSLSEGRDLEAASASIITFTIG